jgi:hypothetical protein
MKKLNPSITACQQICGERKRKPLYWSDLLRGMGKMQRDGDYLYLHLPSLEHVLEGTPERALL